MAEMLGGRLFVVGVSNYEQAGLKLDPAITLNEVNHVSGVLRNSRGYTANGFEPVIDPDRQTLLDKLDDFVKDVKPTETVFMVFAGHGIMGTDDKYYFTTREVQLNDGKVVPHSGGVSSDEIVAFLALIKCKRLVFIIDACFSGAMMPDLGVGDLSAPPTEPGTPPPKGVSDEILATGEGRALITACRSQQRSYFGRGKDQTFFGRSLLDGLAGKNIPSKGNTIGLYELYLSVYDGVIASIKDVNQTPRLVAPLAQEPVLLIYGFGPFPIALRKDYGSLGEADTTHLLSEPPKDRGVVHRVPEKDFNDAQDRVKQIMKNVTEQKARDIRANKAAMTQAERDATTTQVDAESMAIGVFGTIGHMDIRGDVAGGDIHKTSGPPAALADGSMQVLQAEIDALKGRLKGLERELDDGAFEDLGNDLIAAGRAIHQRNKDRCVEKLGEAEGRLKDRPSAAAASLKAAIGQALGKVQSFRF